MDGSSPESPAPSLSDPWRARRIPLDGPVEQARATPRGRALRSLIAGGVGLVVAFVLFQLFVTPVATVALLFAEGADFNVLGEPGGMAQLIEEHVRELVIGNSVGQIIGLGAIALLLTRLHTRALWPYLRVRRTGGAFLGLSLLGLIALMPVVQWLGAVNQTIPLPEALRAMEQSQMEMIEKVLEGGFGLAFNIAMLAVVPAFCEELLFRGYVQRQFERGAGAAVGILSSGIIFGLYHLRLSQVLPLSALGIYLAYLAWRTGSVWPAILVHFANNAFSVVVANYAAQQPELDAQSLETMQVPWYILMPSAVAFVAVMYMLHRYAAARLAQRPAPSPTTDPSTDRFS